MHIFERYKPIKPNYCMAVEPKSSKIIIPFHKRTKKQPKPYPQPRRNDKNIGYRKKSGF